MSVAQPQVAELFETPLLHVAIGEAAEINQQLIDLIRSRGGAPTGVAEWQSDRRMLDWGGEVAQLLLRGIVAFVDQHTIDLGPQDRRRYAWVPEMWASVRGFGAAGPAQCYPGMFWTAIYYVDDGFDGAADPGLGGELGLEDPRMPMLLMDGPDLRFVREPDAVPAEPEMLVRPATGHILAFPSWLRHGARPLRTSGEQITVSVNLRPVQTAPRA